MPTTTRLKEKGFTLFELLLVISLFALSAALVAPDLFNTVAGMEEKLARARLKGDLEEIQSRVFAGDHPVRIKLSANRIILKTLGGEQIDQYQYERIAFSESEWVIPRSGIIISRQLGIELDGEQEQVQWGNSL